MGHNYQNCRTWKYESQWAKWVTVCKIVQTWENESHFINMGHIKIVALISMSHTGENGSHLAKWVKLSYENESHFLNIGHIYQNSRS